VADLESIVEPATRGDPMRSLLWTCRSLRNLVKEFAYLDRLLSAAIVRRNAVLAEIDRYDYSFDPAPTLTALVEEVHESGELPLAPLVPNQEGNA
jgi:Rhodopirellula transposase DDE domain